MQWQPGATIARHQQQLGYYRQRLQRAMLLKLSRLHSQQAALIQTLNAISPLATLERGYAIVQRQDNGHVVKSISQLAVDDVLETRVAEGRVVSRVVGLK
jgi:exodeoxyribonuclease VII large subunit